MIDGRRSARRWAAVDAAILLHVGGLAALGVARPVGATYSAQSTAALARDIVATATGALADAE